MAGSLACLAGPAFAQNGALPLPPPPAPAFATPTAPAPALGTATVAGEPAGGTDGSPAQPPATPPPWAMQCAEDQAAPPRQCRVSTTVLAQPQRTPLARIVLARQQETRSLTLLFQLPHGVWLPAGLTWQIDAGATQRLAFQTSDATGLYAAMTVTDAMLDTLRDGTTLRLSFLAAAQREAVALPIPLAGLPQAVAVMFAAERL